MYVKRSRKRQTLVCYWSCICHSPQAWCQQLSSALYFSLAQCGLISLVAEVIIPCKVCISVKTLLFTVSIWLWISPEPIQNWTSNSSLPLPLITNHLTTEPIMWPFPYWKKTERHVHIDSTMVAQFIWLSENELSAKWKNTRAWSTLTYRIASSALCVTLSVLLATGKEDNDIQLKVSSETLKFPPTSFFHSLFDLLGFFCIPMWWRSFSSLKSAL